MYKKLASIALELDYIGLYSDADSIYHIMKNTKVSQNLQSDTLDVNEVMKAIEETNEALRMLPEDEVVRQGLYHVNNLLHRLLADIGE